MQFWLLLCLVVGMSWAWCIFSAVKRIGTSWIGFTLGLIVGVGCFLVLKILGARVIQRFKLYEPKPPLCRLLIAWFMCGATVLLAFLAPWGVNWLLMCYGSNPSR